MIKELLETNPNNKNVEIVNDEPLGSDKLRRITGRFIRNDMIYSFVNVHSESWNYLAIRFQFVYTLRMKKIIRTNLLELVNSANKTMPSIKVCLNDIKNKDLMIDFSFEMPYLNSEILSDVVNPAIEMISFAPDLLSSMMNEKGIIHKVIS